MKIITSLKETAFSFPDVKKEDSGNYSCVYSKVKHAVQTVTAVGQKSIFIQVKGNVSFVFQVQCLKKKI